VHFTRTVLAVSQGKVRQRRPPARRSGIVCLPGTPPLPDLLHINSTAKPNGLLRSLWNLIWCQGEHSPTTGFGPGSFELAKSTNPSFRGTGTQDDLLPLKIESHHHGKMPLWPSVEC